MEFKTLQIKRGEGNGTPLQYSCLENPMDRGAWLAAVSGVAQSRTRLKQLSSSSSSRQVVLKLQLASESWSEGEVGQGGEGRIVKTQISDPYQFRVSKSVGLGKGPQICIFSTNSQVMLKLLVWNHILRTSMRQEGRRQGTIIKRMTQPLRIGLTKNWLELIRSKMTKD